MQVRSTIPANVDNVDKLVTALLDKNVRELQPIFTKLFAKQTTTRKFERIVSGALRRCAAEARRRRVRDGPDPAGVHQGCHPARVGLMFEVTETAEEDDNEDILAKKSKFLVFSMRQVEDKSAALIFDNGFSTQTTADTVALFSTAHTLKRGGTAKNRPSSDADLSVTSLAQAFIDLDTDTKIESGQIVAPAKGYYLHIAPANRFNAMRIVKSALIPGEANNDINPMKDLDITVVVNPFLSDTDAWYLLPKDKDANGLLWLERRPIHMPKPDGRFADRQPPLQAPRPRSVGLGRLAQLVRHDGSLSDGVHQLSRRHHQHGRAGAGWGAGDSGHHRQVSLRLQRHRGERQQQQLRPPPGSAARHRRQGVRSHHRESGL
jgi:hypothetical protein